MTAHADLPDEPPPELRYRRRVRLDESVRELWRARELVRTLAERDLRARYKQAVLGFAWAIIPPVGLLVVFDVLFRHVAKVSTEGAPYQLYAYLGLLPWTFFSSAVATGGLSLVNNLSLLNKVYCPREVFALANVAVAGADAICSTIVLILLFPINGFVPKATSVWIPLLLVVQVAFTVGTVLIIASAVVYLRDLRHALPIILQMGLFVTPVAYSFHAIPRVWRPLYAGANPLGPVIDGYRRAILLGKTPALGVLGIAAASSFTLLILGYRLFKRLETGIADVA
jgi:ABC-type polysaccharide/polyol phosphate export permease